MNIPETSYDLGYYICGTIPHQGIYLKDIPNLDQFIKELSYGPCSLVLSNVVFIAIAEKYLSQQKSLPNISPEDIEF